MIWIGTDDGNVQVTQDGGKTWSNVTSKLIGLPKESWIAQIKASTFNAGEAYVTANNYRQGDMGVYVYRTKDFGQTWARLVDDKKVVGYALAFQQDVIEPKLMFLGTEQGLWVSVDEGANFTQWKAGFPPVSTMDLSIQEREADLVIATFGRAIYVLDNIRPLRQLAANGKILDSKIVAFANADAYKANYRDAHGTGFGADANFVGENRKKEAKLSYFYNPPKQDTSAAKKDAPILLENKRTNSKIKSTATKIQNPAIVTTAVVPKDTTKKNVSKYDTVFVKIYNAENKLIRTLQHKPDSTGYQAIMWDMAEKGVRFPGNPKPKINAPDRSGNEALAGKYKLVFVCGDTKDSSSIEIKDDPRVPISKDAQMAKRALYARMEKSIVQLTEATDRLTEAEEVAKTIQSQVKDKEGKELEDLGKASKSIQDSIKVKREIITGRKFEKTRLRPTLPNYATRQDL